MSKACPSCPSSTPFTEPDRLTLIGSRKRVKPKALGCQENSIYLGWLESDERIRTAALLQLQVISQALRRFARGCKAAYLEGFLCSSVLT